MKKYIAFFLIILSLFFLMGCSFNKKEECNCEESDIASTINLISNDVVRSNLIVYAGTYGGVLFSEFNIVSQGSGFVIKEDEAYYYVLTNKHVLSYDKIENPKVRLYDFEDNVYLGKIVYVSEKYDLALIRISKNEEGLLYVIPFSKSEVKYGDCVFAVGNPNAYHNVVTVGNVMMIGTLDIYDDVIKHSAPIKTGSSGSLLINSSLELIGINTWGLKQADSDESSGAISLSKINEFLEEYFKE